MGATAAPPVARALLKMTKVKRMFSVPDNELE